VKTIPAPDPGSTEPALAVGTITAVVSAVIGLAVSFGLSLTPEQTAAILAVTTFAGPLVSGWFTRGRVYSPATVAKLLGRRP
jgi:hypothetical protein